MGHRFSTGNFTYGKHVEIGIHMLPICLFLIKGLPMRNLHAVWKYMENPWNTYEKMMVLVLNPLDATGILCVFHYFQSGFPHVTSQLKLT